MSSINGYLVDQKLNKYHRMIEREKANESYSSSFKTNSNQQFTSTEKTLSGYNTSFSKYSNITPRKNMAPFSSNEDIDISSLRSQKQSNSFLSGGQRRSKSPNFYGSLNSDSSDDLLKESTRIITKIERYTRSSSSSRTQSPVSPRSPNSPKKLSPNNSPTNSNQNVSDQDEDRDLQISDLESTPKKTTPNNNLSNSPDHNSTLKSSIDTLNNSDRTSPLKALKRGLSSLFMSQVNKKKEADNYNQLNNQYYPTNIRTINTSSPRSRSLSNTNATSTYNSPSFLSSIDKYEHSKWMKVPSHHSPNFILSDGSNDSPTQKVYNSRSSSPIASKNSPTYANKYNSNDTSKHSSLKNSNFNYYRSQNQNSNSIENNRNSPHRNSPIRSKSPPSPSFQVKRFKYSDSESESTEENFFSQNKKPITANFNSKYKNSSKYDDDDDDYSNIAVNDSKLSQFSSIKKNDDFSLKFSSSLTQKPFISRYAETKRAEINNSSSETETEESYGLKYDQNGELKLPKAETKLTKKFSKQISSLLSPENQRTNGLLMFSDSDSSSSSNFHPKPPKRSISTINQNFTIQNKFRPSKPLSTSSSSDSLFDMNRNKTANNLTNKSFKKFD